MRRASIQVRSPAFTCRTICRSASTAGGRRTERRRRHERSRQKAEKPRGKTAGLLFDHRMKRISVLRRPGSDLLFQALRLSTIGAEDFDGRVRDGIGYRLLAMTTRPAKDGTMKQAKRRMAR